ncbi:hypothetical protein GGX14DRAFT_351079 [Mycena pura]|uniref:F-box domain-containing protein n=1 Tax=Mycena pura TaxID=153505 RepID=A0AAD7E219_9AGAR|nr:hypothetical protein GGX14DRAFT_351079 [Mycena pura]
MTGWCEFCALLPCRRSSVTTLTKRHDRRPLELSAFSSSELVESSQRQIDLEINKYAESIRTLRSRRNALSPVGRLPPEILSRVFFFCSDDSLSWIKEVSHISRHWRTVALGCPQLWSFPVFSQPKWADEMLKRSKSASLTVKADLTYMTPRMVHSVHSSLVQISRIEELDVRTGSRFVPEILNLTGESASQLWELGLTLNVRHRSHFTLPDAFLNGEAPRLRRLELTRFSLRWDSPLMGNLVHLKIQNPGYKARPTIAELVGALQRMPMLETLELDNALTRIEANISSASVRTRTDLSCLKHITITNTSVVAAADVLNHLSYPPTTSMKISCIGEHSTVNTFTALISVLSPVQGSGKARNLCTMHMCIAFQSLVIRAWSFFVKTGDPPCNRAFLDVELKWRVFHCEDSEELMIFACKSLPLRGLQGLSLSTEVQEPVSMPWIRSSFADLPALHTIRLRGHSTSLIAALGEDVILDGVKQIPEAPPVKLVGRKASLRRAKHEIISGGLFFPALRYLTLEDTDFAEPVFEALLTALMARCERKQELWSLALYSCRHLSHDDVKLIREIVSEVTWDEAELGFSDDDESEVYDEDYPGFFFVDSDDDFYPMF